MYNCKETAAQILQHKKSVVFQKFNELFVI